MLIEITRFLLPHGDTVTWRCEISDDLANNYEDIKNSGCRLTLETLRLTNEVSIAIEEPDLGDFMLEILSSEEDIYLGFENMIGQFDKTQFKKWKLEMSQ